MAEALIINEPYKSRIIKRKDALRDWLARDHPECGEQRHLDGGTTERAYWHYGYMMALKDVLRLDGKSLDAI